MKKIFLFTLILAIAVPTFAQWTDRGNAKLIWGTSITAQTASDDGKCLSYDLATSKVVWKTCSGDTVIGNEVTNATDATLTRSGSGTAGSPYTLGINLANANTWTATQTVSKSSANGTVQYANLSDTYQPATGETSTKIYQSFSLMGTVNSGSAYTSYEAARIEVSKQNDFWTASGTADMDADITIKQLVNGTLTTRIYLDSVYGRTQFSGGILVGGAMNTATAPDAGVGANYLSYGNTGMIYEGATNDTSELTMNWPSYTDTTDGDVTAVVALRQGVSLTLGTGITPRAGTLSGAALAQTGWQSFVIPYTALQTAAHTLDLKLFTLPARAIVQYILCDTDTPATFADTLALTVGDTGATYNNWLLAWDGKSDLTVGDSDAERGTALPDADTMAAYMPAFTATKGVYMHADGNATNLSGISAGQWTCSVGFTVLP